MDKFLEILGDIGIVLLLAPILLLIGITGIIIATILLPYTYVKDCIKRIEYVFDEVL